MILITGVAGFIGSSVAKAFLDAGETVIGIDNMNDYYAVALKEYRLAELMQYPAFTFYKGDVSDYNVWTSLPEASDVRIVVHLAAQAGVRYSLEQPFEYGSSNLMGHLAAMEFCRHHPNKPRLVYASSSSVYGGNEKIPFHEDDPVGEPVSFYAATKRCNEVMSYSYAHLYGLEQIGLRFFTVYGPAGRPDMAYWLFTEAVLQNKPIRVFNHGKMRRDFTHVDDIVRGVVATATQKPNFKGKAPHRVYNIGNNTPVELGHFIEIIEQATGREAIKNYEPMQPGDVPETYADIDALARDYGFRPSTPLEEGLQQFVDWYIEDGARLTGVRIQDVHTLEAA